MFVCVCNAVSDTQIEDAVDAGVTSFEAIQEQLGVANTCGTCACEVKQILSTKLNSALASRAAANQGSRGARQVFL
jgi:bacterioferritin-associated ferredoxin